MRQTIDGSTLIKMIQLGAKNLFNNREIINKLNVFPVPDGDTGTNMNLSMTSGLNEIQKETNSNLSVVASKFVKGLLMGARGNSGVILSQLFRGFATSINEKSEINSKDLANALNSGVKTAYQSVTTPVEGTILTVAKDMAKVALVEADKNDDIISLMEKIVQEAKQSLDRTPDLLPILKEVGVVDSGGKGLVVIYEGFLASLKGEELPEESLDLSSMDALVHLEHERSVQSYIDVESIEFGYCTEFIVEMDEEKLEKTPFIETDFRETLSEYGDSLLVAVDEDIMKVHIHAEYPGEVMTIAQKYGDLLHIDVENMRKQYESIVEESTTVQGDDKVKKEFGIIAVAFGSGLTKMFESMGVTTIIEGGQTMNPSTEDILSAIEKENAKHTFILPNNKNIIMAANQAASLSEADITVIPTKTIPQGINAMFSYDGEADANSNKEEMIAAMEDVKTGLVTYAVRDTEINNISIKKDEFIGLDDSTVKVTNGNKMETVKLLVDELIDNDDEILTVFYGEDISKDEEKELESFLIDHLKDDVEIEFYRGNQPIYSYILMIE